MAHRGCISRSGGRDRRPLRLGLGQPEPAGQDAPGARVRGVTRVCRGRFGTLLSTDDGGDTWSGAATGLTVPLRAHQPDRRRTRWSIGGRAARCAAPTTGARRSPGCPGRPPTCAAPRRVAAFDFPTDQTGYLVLEDGSVLSTADGGRTWSRETAVPGARAVGGAFVAHRRRVPRRPTSASVTTARPHLPHDRRRRLVDARARGHAGAARRPLRLAGWSATRSATAGSCSGPRTAGVTWMPKAQPAGASSQSIRCADAAHLPDRDRGRPVRAAHDRRRRHLLDGQPLDPEDPRGAFSSPPGRSRRAQDGTTVLSDDAGATWRPVGQRLDADLLARARRLVLAGVRGRAERSAGALRGRGLTWTEVGVSTSEDVIDVSFADRLVGYALDAAGTLLRTDNGGQSWQILNTGTATRPQAVLALGTRRAAGRPEGRAALDRRRRELHPGARPAPEPVQAVQRRPGRQCRVRVRLEEHPRVHQRGAHVEEGAPAAQGPDPGGRFRHRAQRLRCSARTARCSRPATAASRWLDLSGVGSDDATGVVVLERIARAISR